MLDPILRSYAENELKYHARKRIADEIRKRCPEDQPMTTGITVMLGTVLAMAVFCAMLGRSNRSRSR